MAGKHDLVVGGSGMLAGLCLRLAGDGNTVSLVARNRARMDALASQAPERIFPMQADYRNSRQMDDALAALTEKGGPPDRTFCWVHDDVAPDAPLRIARHAHGTFWHILASAAGNPANLHILLDWRARVRHCNPALDYRQIVLGFVLEADRSRWLTDAEISDGVYNAAGGAPALAVVGTIDPWSRRP